MPTLYANKLADYETDAAIQESLRTTLSSDTTIITIAHRLQTIMDSDKIVSSIASVHSTIISPGYHTDGAGLWQISRIWVT
jgi:ABC-type transport system involved in Fe-S cluster assembly fused permease/ATPase subunit